MYTSLHFRGLLLILSFINFALIPCIAESFMKKENKKEENIKSRGEANNQNFQPEQEFRRVQLFSVKVCITMEKREFASTHGPTQDLTNNEHSTLQNLIALAKKI